MTRTICAVALLLLAHLVVASEVLHVSWPTSNACSPFKFGTQADDILPAFRALIESTPEAAVVALALMQPAILGISQKDADAIIPLAAERYRLLALSPIFARAPSALPYCYAEVRPKEGKASIYVPDAATSSTPVILFVHGFGGSFLWYQHWLSEVFPNHIIICPAYGVSTARISAEYVQEALTATSARLGFKLSTPCLIGLSAGGFGACKVYVRTPERFSQLICLAAYPPSETLAHFPKSGVARFLSGADEPFVVSGELQQGIREIRRVAPATEMVTLPKAEHFFMLTHSAQTIEILRKWIQ